jgi:Glyoxalase-like domain
MSTVKCNASSDLGARVVAVRVDLTVLADPEGNEFCLIR